jgi:hypothetical protein
MTELSNAVTVLIARMETHPEDFEHGNKFGDFADAMWGLVGVDDGIKAPLWYLNDADKQALRGAWAKFHYGRWERDIMEKVFDEDFYKRRDEARLYKQQMEQQMYQNRMAAQNQMLSASTGTLQPGQILPAQNTSGNTGLGIANAFSGLFGSSK